MIGGRTDVTTEEQWKIILEFPDYQISNKGRVWNEKLGLMMSTTPNNYGHVRISLTKSPRDRYTRSVAQMVAEAFVEPPNLLCDCVVVLDGDLTNLVAENLVWRSESFAWKYTHQLKTPQPLHYRNLSVMNLNTRIEYGSVIETGMTEGLLFDDIWRSTYNHDPIYPYGHVFEVTERV